MLYWLYDLPTFLFAIVVAGAFVVFGVTGLAAMRRVARRRPHHAPEPNDTVGYYFGAVVGFYGITLGLISVGVWQSYGDADAKSTMEATTIESLYRSISGHPEPLRAQMQAKVLEYTRHVIEQSWPAQRRGERPSGGTAMFTNLQKLLFAFEPETRGMAALHEEALRQFNRASEYRRLRSLTATAGLPGTMWWVIVLGAMTSIGLTWLFHFDNKRRHLLLTAIYAALIGMLVFLIAAMDNPYRGEMSVGTDAYELVLSRMKKI